MSQFNEFAENICPQDCTNDPLLLPALSDDFCITPNDQILAQICGVYILPNEIYGRTGYAAPTAFSTAEMLTWLNANVDNTNTDNTFGKYIVVEGGLPQPEKTERQLPKGITQVVKRTYAPNLTLNYMRDGLYEMLRKLQCGWTGYTFLLETLGGKLLGFFNSSTGIVGIKPSKTDADYVLGEGVEDFEQGLISIEFESDILPDRIDNPLAS